MATIHLAALPADHLDILSLTFTPAGQAAFGYGPTYLGTFDRSDGQLVDDGIGGLKSSIATMTQITDDDAPESSVFGNPLHFYLFANPSAVALDAITFRVSPGVNHEFPGFWRVVPEPATSVLALAAAAFFLVSRRRR